MNNEARNSELKKQKRDSNGGSSSGVSGSNAKLIIVEEGTGQYQVGFHSKRYFVSAFDPKEYVWYHNRVVASDWYTVSCNGKTWEGRYPTTPWKEIYKAIHEKQVEKNLPQVKTNCNSSHNLSGTRLFGLKEGGIREGGSNKRIRIRRALPTFNISPAAQLTLTNFYQFVLDNMPAPTTTMYLDTPKK
jgi:hypothetical protein